MSGWRPVDAADEPEGPTHRPRRTGDAGGRTGAADGGGGARRGADGPGRREADGGGSRRAADGTPWRPVGDDARRPATWDQERLVHEFMQRPEGRVEEGAVVIRPSLWAALERGLLAFAGISVFLLPFLVAAALGVDDPGPDGPRLLAYLEVVQGLVVPLLLSFAPVIQVAFTRYVVDEEGIRERVQLLSRTDKRVRWEKVTALQHRITLLDRLFGISRIDVIAYGARGTTIRMIGLRRAPRLRALVAKQMRVNASFERLLTND